MKARPTAEDIYERLIMEPSMTRDLAEWLTNQHEFVVEGEVEIEDLLTSTPGGLVRVTQPGMINPIVTRDLAEWLTNQHEFVADLAERVEALEKHRHPICGLDHTGVPIDD